MIAVVTAVLVFTACNHGGDTPGTSAAPDTIPEDNTPAVITGWFDYGSALYKRDRFEPGTAQSICIEMVKNEIEGFQYLLASDKDTEGQRCDVTALTDGQGHELNGTVNVVYYTYLKKGDATHAHGFYPTAMLPIDDGYVGGTFDIAKDTCRTIYVQYKTDINTVPGTYTGTLTVTKDGEKILSGDVSVRVRDIYYDDKTECLTLVGLCYDKADGNPAVPAGPAGAPALGRQSDTGKSDEELTMKYADFMLENRVCPTTLPLKDELLGDIELVRKYMDNPRYVSVQLNSIPWPYTVKERNNNYRAQYAVASENGWVDKCYFGSYDEPATEDNMQTIITNAWRVGTCFPSTRFIDAILVDIPKDGKNIIERISEFSTVYCPKVQMFTGEIRESMLKLKAERGDTLFWYVCGPQTFDTVNLLPCTPGTDKRVLFWQQYQQNVDGFLYWRATFWNICEDVWADDYIEKTIKNSKFPKESDPQTDDGVLIYWNPITKEPVSTLGFESVRDGIEDFQLLKMCEAKFGREKVLEYVEQIATDNDKFVKYAEGSTELLCGLKTQLFDLLESADKN